jgi:hypothetical protein
LAPKLSAKACGSTVRFSGTPLAALHSTSTLYNAARSIFSESRFFALDEALAPGGRLLLAVVEAPLAADGLTVDAALDEALGPGGRLLLFFST